MLELLRFLFRNEFALFIKLAACLEISRLITGIRSRSASCTSEVPSNSGTSLRRRFFIRVCSRSEHLSPRAAIAIGVSPTETGVRDLARTSKSPTRSIASNWISSSTWPERESLHHEEKLTAQNCDFYQIWAGSQARHSVLIGADFRTKLRECAVSETDPDLI